jgi:hypothetical protein
MPGLETRGVSPKEILKMDIRELLAKARESGKKLIRKEVGIPLKGELGQEIGQGVESSVKNYLEKAEGDTEKGTELKNEFEESDKFVVKVSKKEVDKEAVKKAISEQKLCSDYLGPFTVDTYHFVATDEDGRDKLFTVQSRIENPLDYRADDKVLQERDLSEEDKLKIGQQFADFVQGAKEMLLKESKMPDLVGSNNLVIDQENNVKLIDTGLFEKGDVRMWANIRDLAEIEGRYVAPVDIEKDPVYSQFKSFFDDRKAA